MSERWEKILVLGAEGGKIVLLGQKNAEGTWIFTKEVDESVLAEIAGDEDLTYFHPRGLTKVHSWEEAVKLIGRSLSILNPLYVHPEFKRMIWHEVSTKERARNLMKWERLCSINVESEED